MLELELEILSPFGKDDNFLSQLLDISP